MNSAVDVCVQEILRYKNTLRIELLKTELLQDRIFGICNRSHYIARIALIEVKLIKDLLYVRYWSGLKTRSGASNHECLNY